MAMTFWQESNHSVRWERLAVVLPFLVLGLWFLHEVNLAALGHWKMFLAVGFLLIYMKLLGSIAVKLFPDRNDSSE